MSSRGKRYDEEPKLNMKKVFAVIIAIAVVIMFIAIIKKSLTKETATGSITSESYFSVYKENKWGVINSKGEYVIDPSYAEMIVVPNSKVGVFVITYDIDYDTGVYKTKVLNQKNETIFKNYELVEAISNKDKNGNLCYDKDVLKFQKDGKIGLIDYEGNKVLNAEYEEILPIPAVDNSFKVKKDGKYGIINEEGKVIIEPQYADIDLLESDYKSGFIVKNDDGKYGIVDFSNKQVLEVKYDSVSKIHANDLYVAVENGTEKLINKAGEDVLTSGFDKIEQIIAGEENIVVFRKSDKYGVMKTSGETVIEAKYDVLKETRAGIFIAKKDDKFGIINKAEEEKVEFRYTSISYNEKADIYVAEGDNFVADIINRELHTKVSGIVSEFNETKGYIKLKVDGQDCKYKYYNFKFEEKQEADIFPNRTLFLSKKDGKYGFVDKAGQVIVDYTYDDAVEQNECGYAAIKKDGKWGAIDSKGNVIQDTTYNLDNYLIVDFIEKWHLGLDINMNYYNQL